MVANYASDQAHSRRSEGGFTLIELLIALTVLIIGLTGIVQLQMSGVRAAAYARHSTEATVVAENKMEALRTAALIDGDSGPLTVNAQGIEGGEGFLYELDWDITGPGDLNVWDIEVAVTWLERGDLADSHTVTLRTKRIQAAP